jgi:TIR domain
LIENADINLLEVEPPPLGKHRERIEFLAKVLAYGAMSNHWSPKIAITGDSRDRENWTSFGHYQYTERLVEYLGNRWRYSHPQISFLEAFGYVVFTGQEEFQVDDFLSPTIKYYYYTLTPRAFLLLDEPDTPPNIFISHKQTLSSAFGLLIYERLRNLGMNPFIDKDIPIGDDWEGHLKKMVEQSQYYIILLAPETWNEASMVYKEFTWAVEGKLTILPIWHNGLKDGDHLPDELGTTQAHIIEKENAAHYEMALEAIVNRLGYRS